MPITRGTETDVVRSPLGQQRRKCAPLLILGAGASKTFGVPTMPEFISDSDWRTMDQRTTAAALAVRRSLELSKLVDLEEVMYLLEKLATMEREDPIAAPFLKNFTTKDSSITELKQLAGKRIGVTGWRDSGKAGTGPARQGERNLPGKWSVAGPRRKGPITN